jgi:hypothetical protein
MKQICKDRHSLSSQQPAKSTASCAMAVPVDTGAVGEAEERSDDTQTVCYTK